MAKPATVVAKPKRKPLVGLVRNNWSWIVLILVPLAAFIGIWLIASWDLTETFIREALASTGTGQSSVEILAAIATTVGAVIAVAAALYAKRQIGLSREAAAKEAYREQIRLTFEYPQYQSWEVFKKYKDPLLSSDLCKLKYQWFVTHLLFSLEEILAFAPASAAWAEIAERQLERHKGYLQTAEVRGRVNDEAYSKALMQIVNTVRGAA